MVGFDLARAVFPRTVLAKIRPCEWRAYGNSGLEGVRHLARARATTRTVRRPTRSPEPGGHCGRYRDRASGARDHAPAHHGSLPAATIVSRRGIARPGVVQRLPTNRRIVQIGRRRRLLFSVRWFHVIFSFSRLHGKALNHRRRQPFVKFAPPGKRRAIPIVVSRKGRADLCSKNAGPSGTYLRDLFVSSRFTDLPPLLAAASLVQRAPRWFPCPRSPQPPR